VEAVWAAWCARVAQVARGAWAGSAGGLGWERRGPGLGVQGALAGSAGVLGGARFDPCIYTYAGIKRYNKYAYPKSKYSLLAIIGMNMKTFLLHNLLFGHKNNR
jgi:hypothetical protein